MMDSPQLPPDLVALVVFSTILSQESSAGGHLRIAEQEFWSCKSKHARVWTSRVHFQQHLRDSPLLNLIHNSPSRAVTPSLGAENVPHPQQGPSKLGFATQQESKFRMDKQNPRQETCGSVNPLTHSI